MYWQLVPATNLSTELSMSIFSCNVLIERKAFLWCIELLQILFGGAFHKPGGPYELPFLQATARSASFCVRISSLLIPRRRQRRTPLSAARRPPATCKAIIDPISPAFHDYFTSQLKSPDILAAHHDVRPRPLRSADSQKRSQFTITALGR